MTCPACKTKHESEGLIESSGSQMYCRSCDSWSHKNRWIKKESNSLRPSHYVEGHDTFSWADNKFSVQTNVEICRFNIHKYNDRDKGEDVKDFKKVIDYAMRAIKLLEAEDIEERR